MEVLSMTYIADSIGNDYKNWGAGQIVFLSAPTGSGKTTFIFKNFLPTWGGKGKVLYLVNRKILKEQLKEQMRGVVTDQGYPLSVMIDIKTYQEVEQEARELMSNSSVDLYITKEMGGCYLNSFRNSTSYGCVICDECHYFLMDSNYNTNTIYSYKMIRDLFKDKLRIFMSATIEEIQEQIEKDFRQTPAIRSAWLNLQRQVANPVSPRYSDKWKYYSFASLLVESDVSLKLVQELLGHSTITTSMDLYTHVSEQKKTQAMQQLKIGNGNNNTTDMLV